MRIYVYVSSYDPLRIYIYDDGLARFASVKYVSPCTNYSHYRNVTYIVLYIIVLIIANIVTCCIAVHNLSVEFNQNVESKLENVELS